MEGSKRVWFPAVRYGWGWGPPVTWQGWLVLAGFLVLLVAMLSILQRLAQGVK